MDVSEQLNYQDQFDIEAANSNKQSLEERFKALSQQVAEFLAVQEATVQTYGEREREREKIASRFQEQIQTQLEDLRSVVGDFQQIMTQAGAARWRMAAESALSEGHEHLMRIEEQCMRFEKMVDNGSRQLEQLTQSAEKRISRVVRSFRLDYFKHLIDGAATRIDKVSLMAVKQVSKTVKWFHWQRLGVALFIAVCAGMAMGYFINDQLPWQTHNQIVHERQAGQMLLKAWPKLSRAEKHDIIRASRHA